MRILGIDTSGMVAAAALVEDDILLGEYLLNIGKTHSQTLMPMIESLKDLSGADMSEIDAIAVASGPGSFTGLRIGSATAKGLALALDKPIVPVPTVDALAYNIYGYTGFICPMMDARRSQVYSGIYSFDSASGSGYYSNTTDILTEGAERSDKTAMSPEGMRIYMEAAPVDLEALMEKLKELCRLHQETGKHKIMILGDGVPAYIEKIKESLGDGYIYPPAHLSRQRAASVAAIGLEYFRRGVSQSGDEHVPTYMRPTQAERERDERLKKSGS